MPRGDLDRLVHAFAFEDIEADDHFLALGERPVRDLLAPAAYTHSLSVCRRPQPVSNDPLAPAIDIIALGLDLSWLFGHGIGLGVGAHEHHETHGFSFPAGPIGRSVRRRPYVCLREKILRRS